MWNWMVRGAKHKRNRSGNGQRVRVRRAALDLELLEDRVVLDVRTMSVGAHQLVFDAPSSTFSGDSVTGLVNVRVASNGNLLRFDGGVTIGGDGTFTARGNIFALTDTTPRQLFSGAGNATQRFVAADFLGLNASEGSTFTSAASITPLTVAGEAFKLSRVKVANPAAAAPTLQMKGSVALGLGLLGSFDVPLPTAGTVNPYVEIGQSGVRVNADFVGSSTATKSLTKGDWTFTINPQSPTTTLTFGYSGAQKQFFVGGSARLANPKVFSDPNGVTATLGATSNVTAANAGIVITDGQLTRFNLSAITSGSLAVKQLKVVPTSLSVSYTETLNGSTPVDVVTVTGGAQLKKTDDSNFFGSTNSFTINLGSGGTQGIVFTNSALTRLDATLGTNSISLGNSMTLDNPTLRVAYSSTLDANNNPRDTFTISGGASLRVPNLKDNNGAAQSLTVKLGSTASATDAASAGLVISNGSFQALDASINSNLVIGQLRVAPQQFRVAYSRTSTQTNLGFTGAALLQRVNGAAFFGSTSQFNIALGNDAAPGIVVTNGSLTSFNAAVSANSIALSSAVSITDPNIAVAYGSNTGYSFQVGGTLNMSGIGAELDVGGGFAIDTAGALTNFNLTVDATQSFALGGVTIKSGGLSFAYTAADSTFVVSGQAGFQFSAGGKVQTIDIALGSNGQPGLVIQDGALQSFNVTANANLSILGLNVVANALAINYSVNRFTISGDIDVSFKQGAAAVTMKAKLGDGQGTPGIAIDNLGFDTLYVTLNGGFSLYGLKLESQGLHASYSRASQQLVLSGGVQVNFGGGLAFGANIGGGGLTIDTQTGAIGIATGPSGLSISGSFVVGGFIDVAADVRYVTASGGGYTLDVAADIDIANVLDVGGRLSFVNGALDSISLSTGGQIPLGSTGLYITSLSATVSNISNPSNLVVSGSIGVQYGKTINVLGTNYRIFTANGSFTIDRNHLNLTTNSVNLLEGYLGSGNGSIDINWTTGVYSINVNRISLFDSTFVFGANLKFDTEGNINFIGTGELRVPASWWLVGGLTIASGGIAVQIRPGNYSQTFIAGWGSVIGIGVGFKYSFDGSFEVIGGPPRLAPLPAPPQPQPVGYDYYYTIPDFSFSRFYVSGRLTTVPVSFVPGPVSRYEKHTMILQSPRFAQDPGTWQSVTRIGVDGQATTPISQRPWSYVASDPSRQTIAVELNTLDGYGPDGRFKIWSELDLGGLVVSSLHSDVFAPLIQMNSGGPYEGTSGVGQDGITFRAWGQIKEYVGARQLTIGFYDETTGNLIGKPRPGIYPIPLSNLSGIFNPDSGVFYVTYAVPEILDAGPRYYPVQARVLLDGVWIRNGLTDADVPNMTPHISSELIPYPGSAIDDSTGVPINNGRSNNFFIGINRPGFFGGLELNNTKVDIRLTGTGGRIVFADGSLLTPAAPLLGLSRQEANTKLAQTYFQADNPAVGENRTLQVTATATTPGGTEFKTQKDIRLVSPHAPLSVNASFQFGGAGATPAEGDIVTLSATVSNGASSFMAKAATNAAVSLSLPSGLQFVSASIPNGRGVFQAESLTWAIGNLALGESLTMTVQARVLGNTKGSTQLVTVSASANEPDLTPADATQALSIPIAHAPLALASRPIPVAVAGGKFALAAPEFLNGQSGAGGPYEYAVSGLPEGLRLAGNGTGGIFGAVNVAPGLYPVTMTVTDAAGTSASVPFVIDVRAQAPATFLPVQPITFPSQDTDGIELPFGRVPATFRAQVSGNAGSLPMTFVGGSLPNGFRVLPDGTLTGELSTDRRSGSFDLYAYNNDQLVGFSTITYQVRNSPIILTEPLPTVAAGQYFTMPIQLSGGNGYRPVYQFEPLQIPTHLTLSSDGQLSGTPVNRTGANSNRPVRFRATDQYGRSTSIETTLVVEPPFVVTTKTLYDGFVGKTYSQTLQVSGGSGSGYRFVVSGGHLPAGLTLNAATGVLQGTPLVAGDSNFIVTITDSADVSTTASYSLAVYSVTLPTGLDTQTNPLQSRGGGEPLQLNSGTLPTGMTLGTGGRLNGTPTTAGVFEFSIKQLQSDGSLLIRPHAVNIVAAPLPSVIDPTVTLGRTTATLGATVKTTGGVASTRGIVFALTSVDATPRIGDAGVVNLVAGIGGTGAFAIETGSLTLGASYSFAAYVSNEFGISYTPVTTFVVPKFATRVALSGGTPSPSTGGQIVQFNVAVTDALTAAPITETGTVALRTAAGAFLGTTVAINGAASFTLPFNPGTHDLYAVFLGSTNFATGTSEIVRHAVVPSFVSAVVNGGTPELLGFPSPYSSQRSMVRSVRLTFDTPVVLSADAISLTIVGAIGAIPETLLVRNSTGGAGFDTVWDVTFGGAGTLGGSIADGRYRLHVDPSKVTSQAGLTLTAAPAPIEFFRLYGDSDGNGTVNTLDIVRVRTNANTTSALPSYLWLFDADWNGTINNIDINRVRANAGKTV